MISHYKFRAGLLLIIRRINSVERATGVVNITHDYTSCCLYRVDPHDDEQQACLKHVEAYYLNTLIENSHPVDSYYKDKNIGLREFIWLICELYWNSFSFV